MNSFSGQWNGNITGTNQGSIYLELIQNDLEISGTLHINDITLGTYVFSCSGKVLEKEIIAVINPIANQYQIDLGSGQIKASISPDGSLSGTWKTTIGTAGTFIAKRANRHQILTMNRSAFIMMAFLKESENQDVLMAIKRACNALNIEAIRVDDIEHNSRITDLILQHIREDQFLICDVTHERPNVYYELGYAHGINKDVILVAKSGTVLHFDIKDYNIIYYNGLTDLETRISKRLKTFSDSINIDQEKR